MRETAYAKINLALHVRARRADGYHEIESLFAFCEDGDALTLAPGQADSLTIGGPFGGTLSAGKDNLVMQAARMMRGYAAPRVVDGVALHLDKRLPIAAGIGGGSADAAAAIRLLDRHWNACGDNKELCLGSAHLGADVPVCILSETRIGTGIGATFHMVEADDVSGLPVLLVNPGVACPTGPVFRGWDGVDRGALPIGSALEIALAGRNDLEEPALSLVPEIADVLAALRDTHPMLVRMSGSGATCFALFEDVGNRDAAEHAIRAAHPDWWTMASMLR